MFAQKGEGEMNAIVDLPHAYLAGDSFRGARLRHRASMRLLMIPLAIGVPHEVMRALDRLKLHDPLESKRALGSTPDAAPPVVKI